MNSILEKGSRFIWENARLLERVIFEYHFLHGPSARVLAVLRTYQNDDGGFGQALEPDLRTPESQPLFVEFALRTLYDCKLRDPAMVLRACNFIERSTDLKRGIPTIFPSSRIYPRAEHWNNLATEQPSLGRLTGLVGLASWQAVQHPWLSTAVEICLKHMATTGFDDAHTILNAFCLLESIARERNVGRLFGKLSKELRHAKFFCGEVPVETYALTPLTFAPSPDSFCRPIFADSQIEAHLKDLASRQEADGGWPIQWEPPGEMARREWRAYKTVMALSALRAYGRI